MKRFVAVALCLIISTSFVSCKIGSSVSGETFIETKKETEKVTEAVTTSAPLGEYVTGEQTAKVGDVLAKPEIETDGSKLNNFYVKSVNKSNFHGIVSNTYNTMSVKGFNEDVTEFVFLQNADSNIKNDMSVKVSVTAVFLFDNVNKSAKVMMAQSMNTDVSVNNEGVEDQMDGIISSLIGSGDFKDYSDEYTYDEARSYMKAILGMYSGIYFSEYLKTVNPPMEFKKSADEGNCAVYYTSINGESFKFKIDRETGLFQHAAYTTGDNLSVTDFSFTEHLHTEADIDVIEN